MIRKLLHVITLISCLATAGMAQDASNNSGTASILLLRLGANPRVSALSDAFSGIADDQNALYYNPAGLANLKMGAVSLNHMEWFEDIRIENLLFGYNLSKKIGIAAGLTHLWMPGIEARNVFGDVTGSTIQVSSSVVTMGMSYEPVTSFSLGLGIKYFQEKLSDYTASGIGFDFGLFLNTSIPGLSTGIAVQNLGGNVTYDREKQKIPLVYRGGIAYKIYSSDLVFDVDLLKSVDTDLNVYFGAEYVLLHQFSFRVGNKFTKSEPFRPSFGVGFHLQNRYHVYYAYSTHADLGATHNIGFTFNFGSRARTKPKTLFKADQPVVLIAPENVKVVVEDDVLKISWDPVAGVQYNVYARVSTAKEWVKLNGSPLYNNTISYKKLKRSGGYYFRVSSVYQGKESTFSKEVLIHVN
jgi:hypothetical protein